MKCHLKLHVDFTSHYLSVTDVSPCNDEIYSPPVDWFVSCAEAAEPQESRLAVWTHLDQRKHVLTYDVGPDPHREENFRRAVRSTEKHCEVGFGGWSQLRAVQKRLNRSRWRRRTGVGRHRAMLEGTGRPASP